MNEYERQRKLNDMLLVVCLLNLGFRPLSWGLSFNTTSIMKKHVASLRPPGDLTAWVTQKSY